VRLSAAGLVAVVVALSLGLGFAAPAQAVQASITPYLPPGSGGALNILPSVVIPASRVAASSPEALALVMSRFLKSPEVLNAYRAMQAGTATTAQTALVVVEKAAYSVPATVPKVLTKVPPGAGLGVAVGGFQLGTMLGTGTSRLLGFKDEQVCSEQNGVLTAFASVLNGVNCGGWDRALEAARNADQANSVTGANICSPGGVCFALLGRAATSASEHMQCFARKVGTDNGFLVMSFNGGPLVSQGVVYTGGGALGSCLNAGFSSANAATGGFFNTSVVTRYGVQVGNNLVAETPAISARANPKRTNKAIIKYSDGTTTTSPSSDQYTENDPLFKMSPLPPVLPGKIPTEVKIVESTPGLPDSDLMVQPTTPEYQKYRVDYPQCQDGACIVDLVKMGLGSCLNAGTACADWFTDPNKATNYSCTFGGFPVALSECTSYAPKFKEGNIEQGTQLADPQTGTNVGVKTTPGIATDLGAPILDPEKPRECWPSGWGVLNPFAWVYKPVVCASQAMFVPRQSVVSAKLQQAKGAFSTKMPGQLIATVTGWTFISPSSGCAGLTLPLGFLPGGKNHQIMQACPGDPFQTMAFWTRLFGSATIAILTAKALTRYIARIFNYDGVGGA